MTAGLISSGIFEAIPHVEDEAAYWFQAQVFAEGMISVPVPPESDAYWSPFVIDYYGRRFGKYPPGFPLLLSLGQRAGAPWLVNALLGAAALALLADTGRRMGSPATGLLAATLGLTCPVLLAHAGSLLSHPTAVFCMSALLWCLAGLGARFEPAADPTGSAQPSTDPQLAAKWPWSVGAGLAIGYLALTRPYDAVGVGLGIAVCWLWVAAHRRNRFLVMTGLIIAGVAGLVALLLPTYWAALTGSWFVNPYREVYPYDHPGFGPTVGPKGYALGTALEYLRYNLQSAAHSFLGWPAYFSLVFVPIPFGRWATLTPAVPIAGPRRIRGLGLQHLLVLRWTRRRFPPLLHGGHPLPAPADRPGHRAGRPVAAPVWGTVRARTDAVPVARWIGRLQCLRLPSLSASGISRQVWHFRLGSDGYRGGARRTGAGHGLRRDHVVRFCTLFRGQQPHAGFGYRVRDLSRTESGGTVASAVPQQTMFPLEWERPRSL